jgi:hypothetical protein
MDRPLGTSLNPTNHQQCWREFTLSQGITQTLGDLRFGKLHLALGLNERLGDGMLLIASGQNALTSFASPIADRNRSKPDFV